METATETLLLIEARDAARTGRAATLRATAGLSLREMGTAVGVTGACVKRWEDGNRRPHGAPAVRLARLLRELEGLHRVDHTHTDDEAPCRAPRVTTTEGSEHARHVTAA